jgi:hypothetical protein
MSVFAVSLGFFFLLFAMKILTGIHWVCYNVHAVHHNLTDIVLKLNGEEKKINICFFFLNLN